MANVSLTSRQFAAFTAGEFRGQGHCIINMSPSRPAPLGSWGRFHVLNHLWTRLWTIRSSYRAAAYPDQSQMISISYIWGELKGPRGMDRD